MSKKVLKHHRNLAAIIAELECIPSKSGVFAVEELDSTNTGIIQLNDIVSDSRVNVANIHIHYNEGDSMPEHVTVKSDYSETFLGDGYISKIEREVRQIVMDYYLSCINKKGV